MIKTGIPVSVAIFQWLAFYATEHPTWFDRTHDDYKQIRRLFESPMPSDCVELNLAHDFMRWLAVFSVMFNGGIYSSELASFVDHGDYVTLSWFNGITQTMSTAGWDRQTRKAVNYMVRRSCAYDGFENNLLEGLVHVGTYLAHFHEVLLTQVGFLESITGSVLDSLASDPSVSFLVLSAAPKDQLQAFYVDMAALIPEDLLLTELNQSMPANMFFARPVESEFLLLDKVKMHYNLVFYSNLDDQVLALFSAHVQAFIQRLLEDDDGWAAVQRELTGMLNDQLKPRASFLGLVLRLFWNA